MYFTVNISDGIRNDLKTGDERMIFFIENIYLYVFNKSP